MLIRYFVVPFLFQICSSAVCRRVLSPKTVTTQALVISFTRPVNQRLATFLVCFALCLCPLGLWSPAVALAAPDVGAEIRVVGRLPLKLDPHEQSEFLIKTKELARVTRTDDDVISYSCNSDIESLGTYVFEEVWPSEEALQSHLQTEHFKMWWSWVEPHLDGDLTIDVASLSSFHQLK